MNLFIIAGLFCGVSCVILALISLIFGKTTIHRILTFFNICVAIWGFGYFIAGRASTEADALFGWRFSQTGGNFIAVLFYHIVYLFCGLKRRAQLIFIYIWGLFFLYFCFFTNILFAKTRFVYGLYYNSATWFYKILMLSWVYVVCLGFIELIKFIPKAKGVQRIQTLYIVCGFLTGFVGGTSTLLPMIGINFLPYGSFSIPIYCLIVTYAILRHQLLEIEVVVKKSLVFAGMFAFIFMVFTLVALLLSRIFGGVNDIITFVVTAVIIAFSLRPLETWLINTTDKFLFQKKYEYKEILKTFIDEVITELNLDEVINSTLKLLDQTLHPYACSIFILNKVEDKYQLYNSLGLDERNLSFTSESKLIGFLKRSRNPAVIRQIDGISGVNPDIQQEMLSLKAVICLPLMLHDDLIGFISLGKKKSDEEYTKDDLDVLLDLARTESIAIGNSQLLAEAAQAERRAAIGTMAAGINHEIGNPLNIINTKIQVFLASAERGLYKDKAAEEVTQECASILNETIKQTNRIAEITRKLSNFAKPGKEFKPELLTISQEIDNALDIIAHILELERIKINKEISSEPNKILADKREIEQVFSNIIRNAGQAIEDSGVITIRVFSTPVGKVHIEIEDTGKGIPEDKTHRIFEPFFTTKGPSKGTGLGLSITKQLVWKNKGEISFKSRVGVGTTFILEFPKV